MQKIILILHTQNWYSTTEVMVIVNEKKINIIASHVHGVTGDFFVQVANG